MKYTVLFVCPESIESVQSQVQVNKLAAVSANDVSKQCTNGLTLSSHEAALRPQLTSSPVKESAVTDDTETTQVLTTC